MSAASPPLPSSGIYDHIGGISFLLTPDALAALIAFVDRVDLRRLLVRIGVAPPVQA